MAQTDMSGSKGEKLNFFYVAFGPPYNRELLNYITFIFLKYCLVFRLTPVQYKT